MDYDSLDLEVAPASNGQFSITARTPAWDTASAKVTIDLSDLEADLAAIANDEYDAEGLEAFGSRLYELLFPTEIAAAFMLSLGASRDGGRGLRIRLRICDELRTVPWEFLYFQHHIGVDVTTPLARKIDVLAEITPLAVSPPLRVLVVAPGGSSLNVGDEVDKLDEAFADIDDVVEMHRMKPPVTTAKLEEALARSNFHVFHFIGHGRLVDGHGYLTLLDEGGNQLGIQDRVLATLLFNHSIRLAVLSACETGAPGSVAPYLIRAKVPAVVAHQYPIRDSHAALFSQAFYRTLAAGKHVGRVEAAVAVARASLKAHHPNSRVIGTPVVYMRGTGRLFDIPIPTEYQVSLKQKELDSLVDKDRAIRVFAGPEGPRASDRRDLDQLERRIAELDAEIDRDRRRLSTASDTGGT